MNERIGNVTEAQVRREWRRIDRQAARRRALVGAAAVIATALLAGMLAAKLLFVLADVRSDAMTGLLKPGDVALCVRTDAPALSRPLGRGDVALVRYADKGMQRATLRRVIALAGDAVSVDAEGRVTVNGAALEEPYAAWRVPDEPAGGEAGGEALPGGALENPFAAEGAGQAPSPAATETPAEAEYLAYPLTVPEGMAFLLCDNRNNTLDSRSARFGLVREKDLLGRARAIVWPLWRIGLMDGA